MGYEVPVDYLAKRYCTISPSVSCFTTLLCSLRSHEDSKTDLGIFHWISLKTSPANLFSWTLCAGQQISHKFILNMHTCGLLAWVSTCDIADLVYAVGFSDHLVCTRSFLLVWVCGRFMGTMEICLIGLPQLSPDAFAGAVLLTYRMQIYTKF